MTRKQMSFERSIRVQQLIRKLRSDLQQLRMNVCALLAHKDTTPEQLQQVRDMMLHIKELHAKVQERAAPYHIDVPSI